MKLPKYAKATIAAAALAPFGMIYTQETFITLLLGWIVLIPIVACGYLIYGLVEYRKDMKNRIIISVKSNSIKDRYTDIILKEAEIRREKEILYKELRKNNKGM